jgi:hypothetical protein
MAQDETRQENNLFLYDIASKNYTRITTDGRNAIINGITVGFMKKNFAFVKLLIDSDLGKKIGFIRLMKAKCLNLL